MLSHHVEMYFFLPSFLPSLSAHPILPSESPSEPSPSYMTSPAPPSPSKLFHPTNKHHPSPQPSAHRSNGPIHPLTSDAAQPQGKGPVGRLD